MAFFSGSNAFKSFQIHPGSSHGSVAEWPHTAKKQLLGCLHSTLALTLVEPTMDPWKAPQLLSSQKLHGTSLQFNNIHVHSSMICQRKSQTSCVCFPDDLLHPSEEATWASKVGQNRRRSLGLTHYPKILCWSIPHPISFI